MTPAAQYLRMSTDHQRYSLSNQAAAIGAYAVKHDLEIVRTFEDAGKSGLTLRERPGLQALLAEAVSGSAEFAKVLVLDVSRWGRFQDPDQAAHYEFICREAGVDIVYVAEAFANDGSTMSSVVKHLKRVMAGEYSRELGERIRAGKRRQAPQGFFVGGRLPYGVSSQLVDAKGEALGPDRLGQRKNLRDERSIFVWGPPEEIKTIRTVFHWFVDDHLTLTGIARRLNAAGIKPRNAQTWAASTVRFVLTNEMAIGCFVYGKTSIRLKGRRSYAAPEDWLRVRVFKPMVSRQLFDQAQERLQKRWGRNIFLPDEMLTALTCLLKQEGRLTTQLVKESRITPSVAAYRNHFGSLEEAMRRIGYQRKIGAFTKGQQAMPSKAEMVELLKALHKRHGFLTVDLVNRDRTVPSATAYAKWFGSMTAAYAAAGYNVDHQQAILNGKARKRAARRSERVAPPE